jgi:YVTN family beta-propeller protein
VPTSGHPRGIAILPDNRTAYVAQETGAGVDLIDIAQHKVTKSIATGVRPAGAITSHDGKRVYVANGGGGTVSVIDVAAGKVIADVPVGKRAWNMALTADGRKLYVANGRSNSVSVIDTTTLKAIKEIPVGAMPWGVSITGVAVETLRLPHQPAPRRRAARKAVRARVTDGAVASCYCHAPGTLLIAVRHEKLSPVRKPLIP